MAEPLRRTWSRLRGKRASRGAARPERERARPEESRAPPVPLAPAGPEGEDAGPAAPCACSPGGRGRGSSLGPPLSRRSSPGGRILRQAEGPDLEDEDYYENLPGSEGEGWGEGSAAPAAIAPAAASAAGPSPGAGGGRLETGRLRSQLQEAYYLLIQAMHDLQQVSPPQAPWTGLEGHRHPAAPPPLPSSSPSPPLLLPPPSPSLPPPASSLPPEPPLSPPHPPSPPPLLPPLPPLSPLLPPLSPLLPPLPPPPPPSPPPPPPPRTRSLESFPVGAPALLQRWSSDSSVRYSALPATAQSSCAGWDRDAPQPRGGAMDSLGSGCASRAAPAGCVGLRPSERGTDARLIGDPGSSGSPLGHLAAPSGLHRSKGHGPESPFFKPPVVTVKKLQKWMYKGRLLSLGMKGRVSGSPSRSPSPKALDTPAAPRCLGAWKVQESKTHPVPADQRIMLTDLIENVYISSMKKRELKGLKDNELNEQRPHNSITVSKKRNWLHQSTLRSFNQEEEFMKTQEITHIFKSPSLFQHHLPKNANATHSSLSNYTLEFSDENDADDEGEIWYNPIPEDDGHVLHSVASSEETNSGNLGISALTLKVSSGNDLAKPVRQVNEHVNVQIAQASEIPQVNSMCSAELVQLNKQRLGCRTQDNNSLVEDNLKSITGPGIPVATSKSELSTAESSPPSPNPVKKGGSINWSFPDKIKSPKTVRKLSMKMKKLPELSRKLSVKGTLGHIHSSHSPSSLSKCNCQGRSHTVTLPSGNTTPAAQRNVISRYHLDSSVSSQQNFPKENSSSSKSTCKGGYLSDGDSPELIIKSGKRGSENKHLRGKEIFPNSSNKTEIDIDAFRHYSFSDQPKCSQYLSGLMSVHFYGAEDLKPPRMDSKDVFCAIQVDSVNKARTALLTCRTTFLDMDHTFNIEIENAQHLKLVVFSWEPTPRKNRVCCHGTVVLPTLFRVTKTHQLAVKLEPRGLIYVKVTLMEQWENSLPGLDANREPVIFGVDVQKVVEKENVGLTVPLLMQKCIMEIEKRGCQVIGLYRLCGSAAVKKELREAFEKDSKAVGLCENQYPDINVITGVLKDYLRELPSPLITKQLYEAVLDAMAKNPLKMTGNGCENDPSDSKHTVELLDCLPDIEKATLKMLLDHLKLVASYHEVNKMTCQNLAVCFGPVLLSQRQETSPHNHRVFTDSKELASALDFKKHIEVLHYLLQLWPAQRLNVKESTDNLSPEQKSLNCLRRKKQRPHMLNLSGTEGSGVLRPRQTRLDSPLSNRYAGDWSGCGENYFINLKENVNEVDYDDVPSEDTESGEDCSKADGVDQVVEQPESVSRGCTFQTYLAMQTIDSSIDRKVNLKDLQESIDILIGNLERELNKNKLNISV
ncbi:rho GTPase-activating protein SYDE2 [Dromiciops gliroides]|uniref:rho GTPase-activating protein SYDE2 n=1 Tax=Dromiciops gliroides TaxID=33562 RepID=UPI001CC82D3E|nr:rho GTPase-activating protein SYDE2 [Dromiciops gliroides]